MWSLFNSATTFSSFSNTKCAEVYCQTLDSFSIVCTFCEMKNFEFDDFLLHFKNVHLDSKYARTEVAIKDETEEKIAVPREYTEPSFSDDQLENINQPTALMKLNHTTSTDSLEAPTSWQDECTVSNESKYSDGDKSNHEDYSANILKGSLKTTDLPAKHECSTCGKTYKYANTLEHHINKFHNKDKMHKCLRCDFEFITERALSKHVQSVHEGFPCDHCDKTFKSKESLKYHKLKHSGVRTFVCDVENCGKAFFQKKRLTCHKKYLHTQERKYVCEMCGFATKTTSALVVHKRMHTGEKPFACKLCDRRFTSQSQVVEHQPIHSTERPHICDVCGASFARPKALYHHKHLHLGIKKFVCKICGKAYAQAAGLCGHMRQHKTPEFS